MQALQAENASQPAIAARFCVSLSFVEKPPPAFPGALPEAVAPGHPWGAPVPHPKTQVQHQRKSRCAWRRGAPAGRRRGPGRVGRAAGRCGGAGGCAPSAGAKCGLKFLYVTQVAPYRMPRDWGNHWGWRRSQRAPPAVRIPARWPHAWTSVTIGHWGCPQFQPLYDKNAAHKRPLVGRLFANFSFALAVARCALPLSVRLRSHNHSTLYQHK